MEESFIVDTESVISSEEDSIELPRYLYHVIYVCDILRIKKYGIEPEISQKAYNEYVNGCIFLSTEANLLVKMAKESDKADSDMKENIFIMKINTDKLNQNLIFKYNESKNTNQSIFLYHGNIPYECVQMIYVFE